MSEGMKLPAKNKDIGFVETFREEKIFHVSARVFPPLNDPDVVSAGRATHMRPSDRVLGLTYDGLSRAYPLWLLDNYHAVNDVIGGTPILVDH